MHTHIVFSLSSSNENLNDHAVQNYFPDDYSNEIDKALCYLTEAYDIAYECGPAQLLQNTSLFIVKANMLKVCCYNQHQVDPMTNFNIIIMMRVKMMIIMVHTMKKTYHIKNS